jgi:L-alanine-DL-glutamate epimerase-like enolase superfamily enzyme
MRDKLKSRRNFLGAGAAAMGGAFALSSTAETSPADEEPRGKSGIKITDIRTTTIQANFDWHLIRVHTNAGVTGLGEAYWGAGVEDLIRRMKGILAGEDPLNVDRLYTKMMRVMAGAGSQSGATVTAISGIEIALWDLAGKIIGVPVYQLLGGKYRDQVRVYCDSAEGKTEEIESWRERARFVKTKNFNWYKFDCDGIVKDRASSARPFTRRADGWNRLLGEDDLQMIVERVSVAREILGTRPDAPEMSIDCHWSFDARDAVRLAEALAPLKLIWLEDPTPPKNWSAMKFVTDHSPLAIATGENLYTKYEFRELTQDHACDILHVDVPKVGGLREFQRIADMGDLEFIPVAIHNVASPVGTLACAHAAATVPDFLALEWHSVDVPWWADTVHHDGPIIENGFIKLSNQPGLGVELNDDVCRKYLAKGSTYFE